jgi:hypothetical protein
LVPLDEEDALLLDTATAEAVSGPLDPFFPDAILAGVDAARAARAYGCSVLSIQLLHSSSMKERPRVKRILDPSLSN